jgi:hypothetical protein
MSIYHGRTIAGFESDLMTASADDQSQIPL